MTRIADVFRTDGALSKALPGFQPRPAQQQMASAIADLTTVGEQLVVEAETGTGKTFAYVAPALLQSGKVILSTGTRNLQEQLYHRDMPRLREVLAPGKIVTLLKGRANYLCLLRLEQFSAHPGDAHEDALKQLQTVRHWANRTKHGDIGELSALPEDAVIIPRITSTQDNCLGRDCKHYEDCYLVKARKEALEADIVVVNHHLFCADLVLKDTGFGELIPEADLVVFDEAHQLPEIASQYFSETLSTRQITELCRDLQVIYHTAVRDARALSQMATQVERFAKEVRLQFPLDTERGNSRQILARDEVAKAVQALEEKLEQLTRICETLVGRDKGLDQCIERLELLRKRWQLVFTTARNGYSFWYESSPRHVSFHRTPLSVAEPFGKAMADQEARWVFTSATLTVDHSFDYFNARLGLHKPKTLQLESPFNFAEQAMLCMPRYLPEPHEREMFTALADIVEQVVAANHGGTFVLFTSHRMLQAVAKRLHDRVDRTLYVQGSTSKRELLARFSEEGNAVLLGTSSFWEGVDVPGQALRCVIIDKLPFASPDDPLLQARVEDCRRQGRDPFQEVQLPQAVIAMKQGAGRLVRSVNDEGVLIICDNRVVTRNYGKTFLASLPPMARTRSLAEAIAFLQKTPTSNAE
ncbi:ATP-dependent DNA helicase [Aliidiomarina celeris]|uniref:ATP-dependent DNA helicase n=1 Tax=Aliidiomarina celeris TaxID=2249428 RepID=UPI000DEBE87D|nr:ATP-dependent DNA helicase [Aliidiomarina celeris]